MDLGIGNSCSIIELEKYQIFCTHSAVIRMQLMLLDSSDIRATTGSVQFIDSGNSVSVVVLASVDLRLTNSRLTIEIVTWVSGEILTFNIPADFTKCRVRESHF